MNEKKLFQRKETYLISALALFIGILTTYFFLSYNAQVPNAIGKETATVTLEKYTTIQNNLPLLESDISIILYDSEDKPFSYETYKLERIFPYYDESSQQMMYWKLKDRNGNFLPQNITEEQAKEYIKTGSIQQPGKPPSCSTEAFDYYSICIMDERKRGIDLTEFKGIKVGMSGYNLWKYLDYPLDRAGSSGAKGSPVVNGFYEEHYILNDKDVNFLTAVFNIETSDNASDTSKLQKLYIIKKDKTFVEIPILPDGSFDVEKILEGLN